MVWPSYLCLAQNYYDLVHHAQNYYDLEKKLLRPQKNKCRVVWPSYLCLAQNYYDLVNHAQNYNDHEKINVEWSGPLTTVMPKIIITTLKK